MLQEAVDVVRRLPGRLCVDNPRLAAAGQTLGVLKPPKGPDLAVAVLRQAVAAGVNHIDTSDFYGPHVKGLVRHMGLDRVALL
jgi:aryl-alcohol dehydrogenase-like predicted oxidoreductase